MSRAFTLEQHQLLRAPSLHINVLATFFLDEGTYRFCDDITGFDLTDGTDTWIGANVFLDAADIRGGSELTAEPCTLTLDGNRMTQAGIDDPARVLRDIMGYLHQQRRVDYEFGFRHDFSNQIELRIPAYAGKINHIRLYDREIQGFEDDSPRTNSYLEIVLDSLAARYSRSSNRVRGHEDQLEIDPTDQFYSFTVDIAANERSIFWGMKSPFAGRHNPGTGTGGGTGGFGGGGGREPRRPQTV